MALGTVSCTANIEGPGACTSVTVQRVTNASRGRACVVYNAPWITSPTSASGSVGSPFLYRITATNTPTSYSATGLPAGLSINTATGVISGTPTSAGTSTVTLGAANASGAGYATLTHAVAGDASGTAPSATYAYATLAPVAALQFYPVAPCRLVDTRGAAAGFNGIAPFSGPSIPSGGAITIPVQSAAEASANTTPAPCGAIPSTAQAYWFNLTVVPKAGGAVDYVSLWPAGSNQPVVSTVDDPEGLIVSNAAIVVAGTSSGGISVYNDGPSTTDVIIDMNGYFAPPGAGLEFYPVAPCRLVDTRGEAAGFNGISPFSGPPIPPAGTATIPVQSATEASIVTEPAPCGVIPSAAQAYSVNLTVVPVVAGSPVDYVSLWPAGSAQPFVSTLDDAQGLIVSHAAIVPAGAPSGGVSVYNAGPSATDVILDMNGYFATPAALQFYPVAPCRLVDTRGAAAGFNGIDPFAGPSIPSGGTISIPVQSAAEASTDTTPAPCGAIPSSAQAYSINLTVVPAGAIAATAGGQVDYVSIWPAGSEQPFVSTLDDPEGLTVSNAAIVPAGSPSGGINVYNAGPSATDVVIDMNGYFAIAIAPPAIISATSASGTAGSGFSYQIVASNSPTSYSATGLPAGLSVDTTTGLISGTPASAGTSTVTLGAANAGGSGYATLTLTIAAPGAHSVTLTWTASTSPNIAGYNIYRGTTSLSGPYPTLVNSALITTTTFIDTSVVAGQTYYYVATAVNTGSVSSADSAPTTAVIPSP